jgi:hypothetical protein
MLADLGPLQVVDVSHSAVMKLASSAYILFDAFQKRYFSQVNAFTSNFSLRANEAPSAALARCKELAKNVRKPPSNINFVNFGYTLEKNGTFTCLSEDSIACRIGLEMNQRATDYPELRNFFDSAMLDKCLEGEMTARELEAILQLMDAQNIKHTDPNAVEPEQTSDGIGITALGAISGGKGSGKGGKGKGNKGGSGGKGARDTAASADGHSRGRGKSRDPGSQSRRSQSCGPGESTADDFYERAVTLMGQNFENFVPLVELVQAYFLATKQKEIFKRDPATKKVMIPLRTERDFHWKAIAQSLNWHCRRDIYGAMCLLRDLSTGGSKGNPDQKLSKSGQHYKGKVSPDWSALTAEEFKKKYKPNTSNSANLKGKLQQIQIRGETVTEFTA